MSQDTKSMSTINELNIATISKKEEYSELLKKVLPLIKSENKLVKRAAFDFNILLKSAINDINNSTFEYLKDAIEHVIEYFSNELLDLINNKIESSIHSNNDNVHYGLLNDISKIITQQMIYKNRLEEVREFLLNI